LDSRETRSTPALHQIEQYLDGLRELIRDLASDDTMQDRVIVPKIVEVLRMVVRLVMEVLATRLQEPMRPEVRQAYDGVLAQLERLVPGK
jgi:hypothetical protein